MNDIADVATPLFLVLEDYHLITTPAIHEAVSFLLDYQPSQFHLVIVARADFCYLWRAFVCEAF